jgi:hypothetical protein
MKILLIVFSVVFMLACRSTAPSVETSQRDSVAVQEHVTYLDTSFYSEPDSASLTLTADQLYSIAQSPFTFSKKSKHATVKVSMNEDGGITASANCDSVEHQLRLAQKEITKYHLHQEREVKVVKETFVPGFVKFFAWSGGAAFLLGILFLIIKIRR